MGQQRLRASQLLETASQYPSFPIVLEAVRECVNDVFDVPGLVELMRGVRSRQIATVAVETSQPSPFATSLMFGYVAQFLYEGDSPLAERRAAALALDPSLLAELLGTTEGLSLAELLDPEALTRTERELQHLLEGCRARDAEDLTDVLRAIRHGCRGRPLRGARRRAGLAPGPRQPAPGDRVARGAGFAVGRGRGRGAPARRAPGCPCRWASPKPAGAGSRPVGRPARPLRPHPRRLHRR